MQNATQSPWSRAKKASRMRVCGRQLNSQTFSSFWSRMVCTTPARSWKGNCSALTQLPLSFGTSGPSQRWKCLPLKPQPLCLQLPPVSLLRKVSAMLPAQSTLRIRRIHDDFSLHCEEMWETDPGLHHTASHTVRSPGFNYGGNG